MDPRTHAAVTWLLKCGEPAVRLMTRRDVLGEQADEDAGRVLAGAKVTALLSGQRPDGGFGVHPYRKWTGAHWRLVSLVELAIPPREPRAAAAAGHVLAWLASPGRRVLHTGGLARSHASIQGNALAACCRLGLAADPRVCSLAGSLIAWQWPDGGCNCDSAATGRRSSFHESLAPAWGLHEYWQATGDPAARDAAGRAAGLFLAHRLFRSLGTGQVIHRAWLAPHYPPYWHYDILQALLVLSRMGRADDPRASDALEAASESAQRRRLPHDHGPIVSLEPAAPMEAAHRGVDALPRGPDLMRKFLLAQLDPNDAVVIWCLAGQHLRDATRKIQEDQVRRGLGEPPEGGRDRIGHRLRGERHPRADFLDCFARDEQQLGFLKGFGIRGSGPAVGDAELAEYSASRDDRQRQLATVRGADHDLDLAGNHDNQRVAWVAPGEHDLTAAEGPQPGYREDPLQIGRRYRAEQVGVAQDFSHISGHN